MGEIAILPHSVYCSQGVYVVLLVPKCKEPKEQPLATQKNFQGELNIYL